MKKNVKVQKDSYQDCPIRNVMSGFSDKWSILILLSLKSGTVRFRKLRELVGDDISDKMLSISLKNMERDGLIKRQVSTMPPVKVEYSLTKLGEELFEHINVLTKWTKANMSAINKSRKSYDNKINS